jgi:very-short-patch-repair endonuclease
MVVAGIRWELDRYWPEYKLLVELHGGAYHDGEEDLDKDTFKAVKLALVGIQLLPITGNRWDLEPEACLDDVEAGLALRGWLGRRAA